MSGHPADDLPKSVNRAALPGSQITESPDDTGETTTFHQVGRHRQIAVGRKPVRNPADVIIEPERLMYDAYGWPGSGPLRSNDIGGHDIVGKETRFVGHSGTMAGHCRSPTDHLGRRT